MATAATSLTVTIVTTTPGDEELTLEAEIVASDNNDESTYYVSNDYYLRLFKSPNISSMVKESNIGTVSLSNSGLTASVPYEGESDEYLVFTGSNTASLNKVFNSNFSATQIGSVYNSDGEVTSASLTPPEPGYKEVTASEKIYGAFGVTYTTKYDKYKFNSGTPGQMLIFFIGSTT